MNEAIGSSVYRSWARLLRTGHCEHHKFIGAPRVGANTMTHWHTHVQINLPLPFFFLLHCYQWRVYPQEKKKGLFSKDREQITGNKTFSVGIGPPEQCPINTGICGGRGHQIGYQNSAHPSSSKDPNAYTSYSAIFKTCYIFLLFFPSLIFKWAFYVIEFSLLSSSNYFQKSGYPRIYNTFETNLSLLLNSILLHMQCRNIKNSIPNFFLSFLITLVTFISLIHVL